MNSRRENLNRISLPRNIFRHPFSLLYAVLFAIPFGTAAAVGRVMTEKRNVFLILSEAETRNEAAVTFFLSGITAAVVFLLLLKLQAGSGQKEKQRKDDPEASSASEQRRLFLLFQAGILLGWIPAWLTFYPGMFSYDLASQTEEALQGFRGYTRWQPPLHTFLWEIFLRIGGRLKLEPVALYTAVQFLFLSAVCGAVMLRLKRRGHSFPVLLAAFAFFAWNPVMALLSLEIIKDMVFAGTFLLAVLQLCSLAEEPDRFCGKKENTALTILWLTLSCLFRNNFVYALILLLPFSLFLFQKQRKRILLILALSVSFFFVINGPIYDRLGVQDGKAGESLCIPLQQIGKTVQEKGDEIPEGLRQELGRYLPVGEIGEVYNPRFADPVKGRFDSTAYRRDKDGFRRVWKALGKEYPREYMNAFLDLNLPYWYPFSETIDAFSGREYLEIAIDETPLHPVKRYSLLPVLEPFYEAAADTSLFSGIPILRILFSLGLPLWLLFFCFLHLLAQKRRETAGVVLMEIFFMTTYLAGPVSNFRYIAPVFMTYPLLAAVTAVPGERAGKKL